MCDDNYYDNYDQGYNSGYDSGYYSGQDSRDWEIEDLQEEIAELHRRLELEQDRSQRLGIALLSAGVPSHIVEALANGS